MPKRLETGHKAQRIGLLGASFDTGNMGVSALTESAIKCVLHRWPDAEVTLLGSGRVVGEHWVRISGKDLRVRELPIRFCKNIFIENHFLVLFCYAVLFKVFRWEKLKRFCVRRNASLRCIIQMDMVADITGGDSFSDIYGMRRFVLGFLRKWLVLLFQKDLIMLPQTYGPFKRRMARVMATHILKKASLIYSRDQADIEYVNKLLGNTNDTTNKKVRFAPDIAFVLDAREPERLGIEPSANMRGQNSTVIGLNISGLLLNRGNTQDNIFGLKTNYRELVYEIIEMLFKNERAIILLVPHVFPPVGYEFESDPNACLKVYESFKEKYKNRIFLVRGKYNQNEIKHIIGICDFFIGSRMHACIAALSQCIPSVGVAYSKKFEGVFESIGLGYCVADARSFSEKEVLEKIEYVFERKEQIQEHMKQSIPQINEDILNIFHF